MDPLCIRRDTVSFGSIQPAAISTERHRYLCDTDLHALGDIAPLIAAVCRHYRASARSRIAHQSTDAAIEDALDRFGGAILNPRGREVAQLILRGHSGNSIGTPLGISTTAVKTHRKNLYAELGIATH